MIRDTLPCKCVVRFRYYLRVVSQYFEMKSAFLQNYKDPLVVRKEPFIRPKLDKCEVLIEMHACGLCHSDVHIMAGDWHCKSKLPLIPGHEGVGVIAEV